MPDRSRRLAIPVVAAAVGLAAITVAEDLPTRHSIESKLTQRSQAALSEAGLANVEVRFSGRDGTVTVVSADQADRARQIVARQEGVRAATVEVVSAPPGTTGAVSTSPSPQASPEPSANPSPTATPSPTTAPGPTAPGFTDLQRQIRSAGHITFATGSAVLTGSSHTTLARIAAILRANPQIKVRIEGNTDDVGPASINLALSRARAQAVYSALVKLGVAAGRLTTVGYGETHPLVANTSAANRTKNRRVDFRLS